VLEILPDLVDAPRAEKMDHVDQVLDRNGEDARQGDPHDVGHAGECAQRNHDPMVLGAIRLHPAVRDIRDDVVRRRVRRLHGGFDDLRCDPLALHVPRDVAHDIHVGIIDGLHVLVGKEPSPLSLDVAVL
jgi:hypothetical protein